MREEIRLVPLGEVEVYLEDVGALDAPALAIVHGGPGGSSYVFREMLGEELADYRVLYIDQRGSGRSPALPPDPRLFTVDALVEDLDALREALGLERWTLLAHGFGAVPALEYARRFPAFVRGVVLVGPWVHYPWLAKRLWRASRVLQGQDAEGAPEDPQAALEEAFAELEPKVVFDALMFPSDHGRAQYEWVVEGSGLMPGAHVGEMFVTNGLWALDYTPYLMDLSLAPHVIVGEKDGTSYPEQAEAVVDLAGGRLEVIPGAGHYPWIDAPEAFVRALYAALDAVLEEG